MYANENAIAMLNLATTIDMKIFPAKYPVRKIKKKCWVLM